ncbi:MAG: B12-binding domain-containing radical SAM protein [Anaerolineae bacterium]
MKVTLIYPGIGGKGFASLGQGMDSGWIGHGLAILAPCARQVGATVDLIDLRALPGWDAFRAEVERRRPDVVGVSMMSPDYNPAMQSLAIVRQIDPNIRTCVGGPHPTICPSEVQDSPLVDHLFIGEAEVSFPEALRRMMRGEAVAKIVPPIAPDLDAIPFADRSLFLNEWRRWGYGLDSPETPFVEELPPPFVTVIAGRGCMYNCSYCQPAERYIFGRTVRRRSVGNVIAELQQLQTAYRFRSFMFHDDCLTEDRQWVVDFCRAYREAGFRQPFFCQSRADIIVKNEDMVALMAEVGLRGYLIGFESGSDRVLRFIRKGTKVWQNLKAAEICRKYGIAIWANYMLGIPTETQEEMRQTIRMLRRIDPDYYSPGFYTPHPGSDLFGYCEQHGLSLIKDHDGYRRNPTEVKIKGHDPAFLQWALAESQRRTLSNRVRRRAAYLWRRYAHPSKVWRRLSLLVTGRFSGRVE